MQKRRVPQRETRAVPNLHAQDACLCPGDLITPNRGGFGLPTIFERDLSKEAGYRLK